MKKFIALLLSLMMCLGMFARCGSKDTTVTDGTANTDAAAEDTANTDSQEGGETSGETQEVELWYYWETEGHQVALQAAIDDYNASQTDYSVVAKYVPFADFKKQLSIGAVASELPDMVIIDSPDHASYASMGIFADLTENVDVSAYASAIGGENFAVVEGGNVDGAISFLTYMMDETVMTELLASFGYIAGIDAIAQNQFTGDEDYLKFVEQMTYAKARGPHENWPSISDAISLAFNQFMTDAATPADAAATAQATIDSVLN